MTPEGDLPTFLRADPLEEDLASARELLTIDPREALRVVEARLPTAPDPRLFRLAAEACRRLGLDADAEDAELAAIQAGFRVPELNNAAVAAQDGRARQSPAGGPVCTSGPPGSLAGL